jgi:hypothetical protein
MPAKFKDWTECSPEERIQRWEKGIELLKSLPKHVRRKHWDMSSWGHKTACGTAACAAGHMGMHRWFRARGLVLKVARTMDDVNWEKSWPKLKPDAFFGSDGSDAIFNNGTQRSIEAVIAEMQLFLIELKASGGAKFTVIDSPRLVAARDVLTA